MDMFISWMHYLDYIPKLMPITSHNMIKMGGVIQGELTRSVLKISVSSTAQLLFK